MGSEDQTGSSNASAGAGPTLQADASIGAGATVNPDVTVRRGAFVAAGAVVTEDVPAETMVVGAPATHEPLPVPLEGAEPAVSRPARGRRSHSARSYPGPTAETEP